MTITTQKTLCDVTGEEVPTIRAQIGLSHQYDLSHEGAISLLQGVSLPNREARTYIIARCRPSDLPDEPLTGSEPRIWNFSEKARNEMIRQERQQAARECLAMTMDVLNSPPIDRLTPERQAIRERITKAFGL